MEPAKIDWNNIESRFVQDDLFEHINAPKWVDFSAPEESVNDEAWFCKPDCRHPKSVEDFLRSQSASKVKLLGSASVSEIPPLGDRNRRDANLKRRGLNPSLIQDLKPEKTTTSKPPNKFHENSENENPNLSTPPPNHQSKSMKSAIKSSTEKKKHLDNSPSNSSQNDRQPQLKSTLSAQNLFGGRDILNRITEFCNELKKLAMRAKERENSVKLNVKKTPMGAENQEFSSEISGDLIEKEKEKKPLLEVEKENSEAMDKTNGKEKLRRKKRAGEMENIPLSVDLKRRGEQESLLQIRTCPPSPQCFSAPRDGPPHCPTKITPLKPSRSRPTTGRGILREVEQSNKVIGKEEESGDRSNRSVSVIDGGAATEGRSLDVFWFLKPCTLSS
ncbi:hypothetical protein HHK36_019812 [Tetracentron sinense]|uniref:Uncharacterized protein n=1 Tax=Tetracentron sinense TaxID=13715 RepID=A0A834Z0J5_TETSI|nr:hypothetical protein HHK36_019812 [Tetracentron sinense]